MGLDSITQEMVETAIRRSVWHVGDKVLYRLCEERPGHVAPGDIVAKFLLIGRVYAAAVERRRIFRDMITSDEFYELLLVDAIATMGLDGRLAALPETLAAATAGRVVELHAMLMDVLHGITGFKKRSLASKYLHFHRPDLFFIYDSRARKAAWALASGASRLPVVECRGHDEEYLAFVQRCLLIRQHVLEAFEEPLLPRQLDNLLLRVSPAIEADVSRAVQEH